MPKEFDLYMVSIEWLKPNQYSKILRGQKPIKSTSTNDIEEYDVVMYTKESNNYYQIAIETNFIPLLETVNYDGQKCYEKLYEIEKGLWIIKGEWRNGFKGGYHYCPSINTKGVIDIVISPNEQDITNRVKIDINSNIEGFDFEALKDDFEGELWNLLTSNSSKANILTSEIKYGDKVVRFVESQLIINFIHEFEKIVKNPKRELKYAVGNLPTDKVKPIPATFQKLVVTGTDVSLPSKTFVENYDNYENRYLCFMLHRIHQIVQNNSLFSIRQLNKLNAEIVGIKEKIDELQKPQVVNEEQVLDALYTQEQKVIETKKSWIDISNTLKYDNLAKYGIRKIKLLYFKDENEYFGSVGGGFDLFHFPDAVSEYIEKGKEYVFELSAIKTGEDETKKGKKYSIFKITNVKNIEGTEVELERAILEKQKNNIDKLRKDNWVKTLTISEIEEQKNQISTLQKRIHKIKTQIKSLSEFSNEIQQFKQPLSKLLNLEFLKKINLKKSVRFQPSMTYIQDIQYRNALRYYKEILNSEGLDIDIFDLFKQKTSYGVREMPQVFELWSLISIINVLENTFNFKHSPKDLKQLLQSISPQSKKIDEYIKIDFSGNLNGRSVVLHYQKTLSNSKRPDFILEISCGIRKIHIVLDAKFKNYNYVSPTSEIKAMIDKYKVNSDYFVFIVHPCNGLNRGENIVKLTNFGGEKVYYENGQASFPFHNFGYLMIKPNQTDNLKKIIGMSFEYLLDESHNAKQENELDPSPEVDMLCLNCGSEKFEYKNKKKKRWEMGDLSAFYYPSCNCKECGHEAHLDYCWNCRTKLFKHGSYWDYHRTSVWSNFDIHCPKCGMTVADKP